MNFDIVSYLTAQNLGYLIAVGMLLHLFIITFIKRQHIYDDLRGKDATWQIIELSQLIWFVLFPGLVVCDLLGVHAASSVWTSMDAIYLINVGGKVTSKYFESRKVIEGKKENDENK